MHMRINYFALLFGMLALATTAQAQQHFFPQRAAQAAPAGYYLDPAMAQEAPVPDGEGEIAPDTNMGGAASCTDAACEECDSCQCEECCPSLFTKLKPGPGWFGSAEYMLMWNKTRALPPLVTTGPPNPPPGNPFNILGLNDPGVQVLFGGTPTGDGLGSGGRLTIGKWLDEYETFAIAGKFWAFRGNDGSFTQTSDGLTNIGIPFIDAQNNQEEAYIVGFTPNGVNAFSSGVIGVQDRLDMLGAEAYAQFLVYDQPGMRIDLLGGYHALRLDNSLQINSTITSLDAAYIAPVGSTIAVTDIFEGRNEFNGGEFGLAMNSFVDRWSFNLMGKMSIGNMHQTVITQGNTVINSGGVIDNRNEGLFALGTNIGTQSRDKIAYIPEVNAKVGYWIHPNVNVSVGYTFLYINSVVLGGDQLDRTLNLSQTNGGPLIGPARPTFLGFRETDYWMQGINFGVECKF